MARGHQFRSAAEAEAAATQSLRAAKELLAQTGACASPQAARLIRQHLADVDKLMATARRLYVRERGRELLDQQLGSDRSGSRFEEEPELPDV